jgi:hypothetical protein
MRIYDADDDAKYAGERIETLLSYIMLHLQPASAYWDDVVRFELGIKLNTKRGGREFATAKQLKK